MNSKEQRIIVTEGDSRVNTITSLGELRHLASCMKNSIQVLHEYVKVHIDHQVHQKKIIKQINLLLKSVSYLDDQIKLVTGQQGMTNLSSRAESRKRAACNLDLKRDLIMNKRQSKNYLSIEDNVLARMVVDTKPTSKILPKRLVPLRKTAIVTSTPKPNNGSVFTLREAFQYIQDNNMSVTLFYDMATNKERNPKHPTVLCSRSTFCHRHKIYKTTQILPPINDQGIAVGRPQYVADNKLKMLNKDVNETIA